MIELFLDSPAVFGGFLFVLGLLVGSFLNVVIHRIPKIMEQEFRQQCQLIDAPVDAPMPKVPTYNLIIPRSACPGCGHAISALENIPVISYLVLRGRCKACKTSISPRYPLIELLCATLTTIVGLHFGVTIAAIAAIMLTWSLISLVFIDADTYLLPDSITLPLLWLGLLFNLNNVFVPLDQAVIGAVAGYLALWSVYWLFKLITKKEGMGYGDFKLLAALGAWFGWQALPSIILLSSISGAVIGIALAILAKRGMGKPMPFGPYLGIAGWLTLLLGSSLQQLIFNGVPA
ncbi:prepilin peptidase [Iodobacter fluviatilis]|uniref:Prepilin leader peptidase/N-methyltransferase n=1 Tax=Iodobacter fluviatilis TaxID=537 RepID=A0A377T068_9NEIS|nr:A24 family peptidase [Iodobacter fluviatilis]TCU83307.1 type 4 prepilin peptidase 1 [Iodobacter fluviatilis]STR45976.1 Pectic enzymes secretion protein outO [Iodobacter fluviatilis]